MITFALHCPLQLLPDPSPTHPTSKLHVRFFVVVVVVLNNPPRLLNAAYMCTDVVPSTETWATTRVMPLKINEFPSFSSNLLPIALQFGVRLCVPPSPRWNIDWFDIVRLLCISPQLL